MKNSPLVLKTAVANSKTPLNLDVLVRNQGTPRSSQAASSSQEPSVSVDSDLGPDLAYLASSPARGSHLGSPHLDELSSDDDDGSDDLDNSQDPGPSKSASTPTPRLSTAARGSKRKQMHETLADIAQEERQVRAKVAIAQSQERTRQQELKYEKKYRFQQAQLDFQREEAEKNRMEQRKQREHELMMLEKKIELERLMRGAL